AGGGHAGQLRRVPGGEEARGHRRGRHSPAREPAGVLRVGGAQGSRARHAHERPKLEEYGDSLFAVLHTVEMAGLELPVGEVDIFVGRNYVLSVRNRCEHGFTNVRARCEREPELLSHGAGFVFYALMDAVVDRYFPVLDTLEMELERVEER